MGSFEPWKSLVASALVWLGQDDVTSAVAREDSDEDARKIEGLMVAWDAVFGTLAVRTGDVLRYCESGGVPPRSADDASGDVAVGVEGEDAQKLLTFAVCAFCPPKGTAKLPLAATLGKALAGVARRNVGGRSFEAEWHSNLKQQTWRLVAGDAGDEPVHPELAGDAGVNESSTRKPNPTKQAVAGDAGDAGDDPRTSGRISEAPHQEGLPAGTKLAADILPAGGQPSPASPASPASPEKQADRLRVENLFTPASPASHPPQGYFIAVPIWVGPASAAPDTLLVYELHGTRSDYTLAVFALEADGQVVRVAVDIGDTDRAHRWATAWDWGGEWDHGGLVGFGESIAVRLVLGAGLCTTLSTINPKEDLTPGEWSTSFRLSWALRPAPDGASSS
jgi:hypothetical protein